MLQDQSDNRIRLLTSDRFNGMIENAIEFLAWDQSTGSPNQGFDRRSNGDLSNTLIDMQSSPLSDERATASLMVEAVDDAPTFDLGGNQTVAETMAMLTCESFR